MKTVIIALNSKYIHSSLAPWYLKYACGSSCGQVNVLEYTINDNIEWVLSKIYAEKPDIAAFSCYIWNIDHVHKITSNLKKVLPDTRIILGGPEVSYTPIKIMEENPHIDFIICGEGEESFRKLLSVLSIDLEKKPVIKDPNITRLSIKDIQGLCYRNGENIIYDGGYCKIKDLDSIPTPYTDEMFSTLENNKIVYYEASRGCPFYCSYCISSTFDGVRYFSMDRVENDLSRLINAGVKQIKFVDRTFNCNKQRAMDIIKFAISNSKETNFHFEVAGDLFDDELIQLLSRAPEGLIQLEIGIQTVNTEALAEIRRKTDTTRVLGNIRKLISNNNIHIHLDLIAALPFEDYSSFQRSFNIVYMLEPHHLQLGFLKMLKGSYIRSDEQIKKHQYSFREYPPYEVLCNKYMNFSEIAELKGIEEVFERYYNSGRFSNSLKFIIKNYFNSPFEFYREFYLYNLYQGYLDKPISARDQYSVFLRFTEYMSDRLELRDAEKSFMLDIINDLLKLDYLSTNNTGNLPEEINRVIEPGFREKCKDFLKDENNVRRYLPEYVGMSLGQILKNIRFEIFSYNVISLNSAEHSAYSDYIEYSEYNSYNKYNKYSACSKYSTSFSDCNTKAILNDTTAFHDKVVLPEHNVVLPVKQKVTILFDYSNRHKVTGAYRYTLIDSKK